MIIEKNCLFQQENDRIEYNIMINIKNVSIWRRYQREKLELLKRTLTGRLKSENFALDTIFQDCCVRRQVIYNRGRLYVATILLTVEINSQTRKTRN